MSYHIKEGLKFFSLLTLSVITIIYIMIVLLDSRDGYCTLDIEYLVKYSPESSNLINKVIADDKVSIGECREIKQKVNQEKLSKDLSNIKRKLNRSI